MRSGFKTLRQLGRSLSKDKPKRLPNRPRMIFAKLVNISKRFSTTLLLIFNRIRMSFRLVIKPPSINMPMI